MTAKGTLSPFDEQVERRDVPALKVHPRVLGGSGDGVFAASVADMDFKAPPCVLAALHRRLEHGVFGYEAVPDGLFPALTGWFEARHGWQVDPAHILRAPNVLNALAIAASLFTEPGDGVIVQPPVFFDFFDVLCENGRNVVENPLLLDDGRYRMDFADLESKAADPRTTMLFLCNPHNPVGRVWTRTELAMLADICARHGVLVVADEIHADIVFSAHTFTPFASLGPLHTGNSITCISPAKSFNIAACSQAFTIISDDRRRERFQAENSRLTVNKNNAFASVAMESAYREGAPWLDAVRAYLQANLTLVRERVQHLPWVDLIEPDGTFLAWMDFRALGVPDGELKGFLRQRCGWHVSAGESFGAQGQGFARVNIACPRGTLIAALDALVEGIAPGN